MNTLIFGVGGTTHGMILSIATQNHTSIIITNRIHTKTIELVQQFDIQAAEFADLLQLRHCHY